MIEKKAFRLMPTMALFAVTGLGSAVSHADQILVQQTDLFSGSQTVATNFNVTGPGTVSVSVTDMSWPDPLQSLSFMLSTANSVFEQSTIPGSYTFDVTGAGVYSAIVSGVVSSASSLGMGLYSLKVDFVPTVPLPASAWLLLSGIAGVYFARKGRKPMLTLPAQTLSVA